MNPWFNIVTWFGVRTSQSQFCTSFLRWIVVNYFSSHKLRYKNIPGLDDHDVCILELNSAFYAVILVFKFDLWINTSLHHMSCVETIKYIYWVASSSFSSRPNYRSVDVKYSLFVISFTKCDVIKQNESELANILCSTEMALSKFNFDEINLLK